MNDIVIMEKTGKAEKFLKEEGFRLGDIFELMQKARQDERSKLESEIAELNARWEKLRKEIEKCGGYITPEIMIEIIKQIESGGESVELCSETKSSHHSITKGLPEKPKPKKGMRRSPE